MSILREVRRQANSQERWADVFGNQISQRTNVLDLPAHYPYSPERWRLSVDGTRQLLQYGSVPQYTHTSDSHELSPAAGETVTLQSAERPRYVVQYELAATFAFELNQSLQTGDQLRIGLYDGSDGWYLEQDGSHADDEADFVLERNGSEVYRKTGFDIHKATQEWARLKLVTGWYDVTRQLWERSYSDDGEQENRTIGKFSADGVRGSRTGNLPLHYEVTAGGSTTGLTLKAGSCAQVNLGETVQFNRSKKTFATDTLSVTGAWEPLRAFRVDPDRYNVNVQISNVSAGKYTQNADVEILLVAADPSNVLDGAGNTLTDADFSYPPESSSTNNVIQESTAVEQAPDNTGTPQSSMTNPGGWQLARSELLSDSGRTLASSAALGVEAKRPIYEQDFAVVLGKSPTAGDVSYQIQTEQDW